MEDGPFPGHLSKCTSDFRLNINGSLGFRWKRPHLVVAVGQAAGSLANPGTSSQETSDPENTLIATFQDFGLVVEAFGKTNKPPLILSQQCLLIFALLGDCTTTGYGGTRRNPKEPY
jgi:hypothetical protein